MARCFVFAGPTVIPELVQRLLPESIVCPPVTAGDLLRLGASPGDTVAIIDGLYYSAAAVRHKEILALLHEGVHVLGASSMGALRAAELHPFGMVGLGEVFRQFANGELDGDDEVALLHGDATTGYRPITEALVNLRRHVKGALESDVLTPGSAERLIQAAKAMPFTERTLRAIMAAAEKLGVPRSHCEAFLLFVREHGVDLKHQDALALLRTLGSQQQPPATVSRPEPLNQTIFLRQWVNETRSDIICTEVPERHVLAYCRLHLPDYREFHRRVSLTYLLGLSARSEGFLPLSPESILASFRLQRAFLADGPFEDWLRRCHLSEAELIGLLEEQSLVEQLMGGEAPLAQTPTEALEAKVPQYLHRIGLLSGTHAFPAEWTVWLTAEERADLTDIGCIASVAVRSLAAPPRNLWPEPFLPALKASGIYARAVLTVRRAFEFNALVHKVRPEFVLSRLSPEVVTAWYQRRWGVDGEERNFKLALLDRGFGDHGTFLESARTFYLFDVNKGQR